MSQRSAGACTRCTRSNAFPDHTVQARNAHNLQFTVHRNLGFSHRILNGNNQFNIVRIVMHEYSFICIFTARRFHDLIWLEIYYKRNNSYFISHNLPMILLNMHFFGLAVPLFHTYFKFTMSEIMLKVAF